MASKRDKIRLISSAGTGHFYTTDKNKKNTPDKMEVKKYDPVVRKHVTVQGRQDQVTQQSTRAARGPCCVIPAKAGIHVLLKPAARRASSRGLSHWNSKASWIPAFAGSSAFGARTQADAQFHARSAWPLLRHPPRKRGSMSC